MWRLTTNKLVRDSEVKNRAGFDAATNFRYGDQFTLPKKMRGEPKQANEKCDPTFDEVALNILEADIVDDQWKPLHPTSENGYFD